ncbi:MAG: PASTA domain-containing protein [Bacteroidetes bacterium]|jgi:eukaryotic-like serine/threonine-protein kinase|nr:PASTA domain-containing protein [Bacteroidota bacterium]
MNKNWWLNLGLGIVATAVFILLLFLWMNWFTNHNVSVQVPNVVGLDIEEAIEKLDDAGLRYEITDSVYLEKTKKDAVSEQDPIAGSDVKPNRIIYVVVNALDKPKVKMPKLIDQSLTLAKVLIKNNGLELGNIEYIEDDIGNNLVTKQTMNGSEVPAGKMITKGSRIDLIVVRNKTPEQDYVDSTATETDNTDEEFSDEEKPKRKKRKREL